MNIPNSKRDSRLTPRAAWSAVLGASPSRRSGFTMIEIALAIAVIAFALVAIVGILPLGMETQRDNRQETIVNHDGTYLLEAIRGGAPYQEDLASYVDALTVNGVNVVVSNSADLIRALSTVQSTNVAIMRSISGAAAMRSPEAKDFAMHYRVVSQVLRADILASVDPELTNSTPNLADHLYEIRLALYWPLRPRGAEWELADNARRQVFRTLVSGTVDADGFLNTSLFVRP
jgi:hypothetical protein